MRWPRFMRDSRFVDRITEAEDSYAGRDGSITIEVHYRRGDPTVGKVRKSVEGAADMRLNLATT